MRRRPALANGLRGKVVPALLAALLLVAGGARAGVEDCTMSSHLRVLHAASPRPAGFDQAEAVWLSSRVLRWPKREPGARYRLLHSATSALVLAPGETPRGFDDAVTLEPSDAVAPANFSHVAAGATLAVPQAQAASVARWLRGQLVLVQEDEAGRVQHATAVQHPGALDDLYRAAADAAVTPELGAAVERRAGGAVTRFVLWAPTARDVALCLYQAERQGERATLVPLQRDDASGIWRAELAGDLSGRAYLYLVDVVSPPLGLVRQRVTDPYSLALGADSRRSVVVDLDDPRTQPPGWRRAPRPAPLRAATDLSIYELHVRDFSLGDASVPRARRGTYLAFTQARSRGMRHLRRLAAAGLTDVHLLPVFDLASVPERGCVTPDVGALRAGPASEAQQAAVSAVAARDCFNWGYDPLHFNVPEGSYSTDAAAPLKRIVEFRAMVMALHRAGLRVGMDVVYNHMSAAGNDAQSVLDRIVPGYYHRLDAAGRIERSTCCDNTATEHAMMARLMIDSAVVWARHYRIDSFRFDLMGHQPRAAMERLQRAVDAAAGRSVQLIGEGWNFGEVKDGARFVQASQLSLPGSGIATFSDRARDAVRGGGCCDSGPEVVARQGWVNGLGYDANDAARAAQEAAPTAPAARQALLRTADLVRAGLAGTLRDYRLQAHDGSTKTLAQIDYAGQPAGYAAAPGEVVNYVENHDNQTLFDLNALKLPRGEGATSREDRARVQVLALATTAFSQGIAYWHAGVEILRSKSLDRNSYDSGDWFNRIDWTLADNHFGTGLPPQRDNGSMWPLMKPVLEDASIKPRPEHIRFTRDAFVDLLRIRASSRLFRLESADEVQRRLTFHDTGPQQQGTVIVGHLDGRGLEGAGFAELLYAINVDKAPARLQLPALRGRAFVLHPVQRAPGAADKRPARQARWDAAGGTLVVPPRTAVVYVLR